MSDYTIYISIWRYVTVQVDTQYCVWFRLKDKGIPSDIVRGRKNALVRHNKESFFDLQSFSQLIFARVYPDETQKKDTQVAIFQGNGLGYKQAFTTVLDGGSGQFGTLEIGMSSQMFIRVPLHL